MFGFIDGARCIKKQSLGRSQNQTQSSRCISSVLRSLKSSVERSWTHFWILSVLLLRNIVNQVRLSCYQLVPTNKQTLKEIIRFTVFILFTSTIFRNYIALLFLKGFEQNKSKCFDLCQICGDAQSLSITTVPSSTTFDSGPNFLNRQILSRAFSYCFSYFSYYLLVITADTIERSFARS